MRLTEILKPQNILVPMQAKTKNEAIGELVALLAKNNEIQDAKAVLDAVLERETTRTTGIGNGLAIPHGKLPKLGRLFGLFARLERPIDFEALDSQSVDLIFLLLAPEAAGADHLKALARVARLLRDPEIARKLRESRDADALYAVLAMPAASSAA